MAMRGRIRSVKPEFYQHGGLYDAEVAYAMPLRLAYEGLWNYSDREGRFEWKPRELKLNILPYDPVDFTRVLDALATRGFVVRYAFRGREYGWIPTFKEHQVINNREEASKISPPPPELVTAVENGTYRYDPDEWVTREVRVDDASGTRDSHDGHAASGEGSGRDGNGTLSVATQPAAGRAGETPKGAEPPDEIDINKLSPGHRQAVGGYLKAVRGSWWAPDGEPPAGWNDGREASIYFQRRKKGESHDDLIRMVHGARFLVDQGEIEWEKNGKRVVKPGDKLTGRLLNNTHNGARDFGSMALDAYGRIGEAKPPPTDQRKGGSPAAIGSMDFSKFAKGRSDGAQGTAA